MANQLQTIKTRYGVVGECEGLNLALETALKVAPVDLSVLIIGESGVGKEVIPRIIHDNSPRKKKKYIAVNCGSIPEGTIDSELFGHEKGSFTGAVGEHDGYFGAADGGTLFLDEVGELPMSTQARLLRVLETGEYMRVGSSTPRKTNVRIVAATNVNMQRAIATGHFRQDLYYRLNAITINMPPLRDRGGDVLLLFKKFAMDIADEYRMDAPVRLNDETADLFRKYSWPGNIRQLRNMAANLSVNLVGNRTVDLDTVGRYLPEMLADNGGHSLMASGRERDSHDYEVEREIIFKMLLELHADMESIKQAMGMARKAGKKALPAKEEYDEYEEQ